MGKNNIVGRILCFFGIHKSGKNYGHDIFMSNVIDWKKQCQRCGKIKKWVEAKPEKYGNRRFK